MKHKQEKNKFAKVFGIFIGMVLLLTFLSKSIYNYQLPVVSVSSPKKGRISFTVEGRAEVSYSYVDSIYANIDGRVKDILVQAGDEVQKGQCIMQFEMAGTGEITEIVAENTGIITSIGVKKGMYVSSMQNTIIYEVAEKSEEWTIALFITDEQLEYVEVNGTANVEVEDVNERFVGEIQAIVPYANQSKTGYLVRILICSEDMEIVGRQAKVTIRKDSPQYDALIPVAALRKDAVGYYVLVLQEEDSVLGDGYVAHRMSVDLLDSDETYCAVIGLPSDEIVIVAATSEITDGSKVYYEGEGVYISYRWNELPKAYNVELTELSNGQKVDSRIYPYLQEMFDEARAEGIYCLCMAR